MLVLGLVELPWWAILLLLLVAFYIHETWHFGFFKKHGIPYEKPWPVIGSMMSHSEGLIAGDTALYKKYRDVGYWGEFLGIQRVLSVIDEKLLADIYVKEFANFTNHPNFCDPDGWVAKMLPSLVDEEWKHTRTEISPAFSTGKLKRMNAEINDCAKLFGEYMLEKAKTQEPVDVNAHTGGFALDAIATTAFGLKLDSQKDHDNVFVKNVKDLFNIKPGSPGLMFLIFFPKIAPIFQKMGLKVDPYNTDAQNFLVNITRQLMEERTSNKDKSRNDFLQLMMDSQSGQDIRDEDDKSSPKLKGVSTDIILGNAMGFLAGGYDSTSSTLSFLMYSLATNPNVQTKLIAEIDSVVRNKESVSYDQLGEMPYVEQCIMEALRLCPPFMKSMRITKNDITLHGLFIPKGMVIQIPVYAIQRDPTKWPNPESFDPDRFSAENKRARSPYHFLPFSAGQRNCPAQRLALQELKMAIIHLLTRVTIETCHKTQIPVKLQDSTILKPENLWLKMVQRRRLSLGLNPV